MSEHVFERADGLYVPSQHAIGPWDPNSLHGGAPAAVLAGVLAEAGGALPGRLTLELLRPVPRSPLRVEVGEPQGGRRVRRLAATVWAQDREIIRASALFVSPVPAGGTPGQTVTAPPPPQEGRPVHFSLSGSREPSFAGSAMEMRFLSGAPGSGEARVWMRLGMALVEGEPTTPLQRVMAAADFGNGIAAALPFEEWVFINADLHVALWRAPEGEWVLMDSRTHLHEGSTAVAESLLSDQRGPVGRALQSLVVERRA